VFRNGQLLNNDQFNLTDTNQITIVSTSFKVGANYTVATVSGIGSVGSAQGDPVYPEAGIAVSTGTTWTTSIPNNSNSWNIAYNDKINNAVFSGTDTKTLTLMQYDGGTFAPTFTDLQGVTGVTAGTGLTGGTISTTGTVAADTSFLFTQSDTLSLNLTSRFAAKQNTLTNPVTGTGTTNTLPLFTGTSTLGNSVIQESSGNIGIGVAPTSNLELAKGKFITLNSSGSPFQDSSGIMLYEVGTKTANDINFGAKIMYNGDSDNFEIKMKNFNGTTLFNPPVSISIPRVTGNVNIGTSLAVTGAITEGGNNVLTNLDTASLSSRIDGKVSLTGDQTINGIKTFGNQVNMSGQITISGSVSGSNRLLGKNTSNNGVGDITLGTGLNLSASNVLTASGTDTTSLSDRINLKYNSSGGTISGAVTLSTTSATPTSLLGKDGSNVVGTVTTVAQTGLMTRGETTATTGSPSAVFTVTHGLGSNPSSIIITSAGIGGGDKIIFEVYTKSSTTFSVQAWNLDGTEASSKSVKIYWLAIK
jgi:hypothetical protein